MFTAYAELQKSEIFATRDYSYSTGLIHMTVRQKPLFSEMPYQKFCTQNNTYNKYTQKLTMILHN
jgi:hypothetical protein